MEKKLKNRNTAGVFAVAVIYAVFKIGLMHGAPFHGFSDAFMNMIYSPASVEGALLSFVIALILPMALQILTASCVTEDLSGAVVYILPRAGTLRRWFFGKVRQLLSACTAAVSTVTLCIGGYSAYRYGMPSKNDWRILLNDSAVLFVRGSVRQCFIRCCSRKMGVLCRTCGNAFVRRCNLSDAPLPALAACQSDLQLLCLVAEKRMVFPNRLRCGIYAG